MLENAVRHAQPAHVGILRGRDIEQAVIAPAEIIGRRWRLVVLRLVLQPLIGIEWMLFALELFLVSKLLAASRDLVLRLEVNRVRPDRFGIALGSGTAATEATTDAADLQPRGEALEVALLLVGEVDGYCFEFHCLHAFIRRRPAPRS